MAPRPSRFQTTSRSCSFRRAHPNSTARKTSGSSCVRIGCQTGFSNPSTISSTTAATLGTHSLTNPGRLCPSRDATGQQSITQSEDWYKTALTASAISDYLEMEQRWLALGRSYEFTQRLSNFTEPFRDRKQSRNRPPLGGLVHARTAPRRARSAAAAAPGFTLAAHQRLFFLLSRRLVATTLPARDRAAIVSFDRGSHHPAVSPWADRDAAWADADGDV